MLAPGTHRRPYLWATVVPPALALLEEVYVRWLGWLENGLTDPITFTGEGNATPKNQSHFPLLS